jgi:cytochrome c553
MARLMVFLGVLVGFVIILTLANYRNLPVTHEKFNYNKSAEEFHKKTELVAKITAPKEVSKEEEVVVAEYAPKVDLNTPQLVSGEKIYTKCIACHGKGGEGKASQKAAHIGGQYDWYIEKQLVDMKAGIVRVNEAMMPTLKGLSAQDMKDVAAYVSKLPWKKP